MVHRLRRSAALLSVLLLLPASQVDAQEMVSVAANEANMRSGPGTEHAADWILDRGYPLEVIGRQGDWLKVRDFENDTGWIHRTLTGTTPYHIVKVKVANLRSQPTTSSRIIGRLFYGDALRTLERRTDWVKVRSGGLRGWVARRLLWGW